VTNTCNLYETLIGQDFVNVGPATATRLLSEFTPEELVAHLDERNSEVFRCIKGINEKTILGLYRGNMVLKKKIELARVLDNMGHSVAAVNLLYGLWRGQTIEKIRRNPYQLLFALPWEILDPIGLSLGVEDHPCRLAAAVENCMYSDYEQGKNTCVNPPLLFEKITDLLGCNHAVAERAVGYALKAGAILQHGEMLQLPAAYAFERQIEQFLRKNREYGISADVVRQYLRGGKYCYLTEEQESAVIKAMQNRIIVIHGRGGRGKTTTLAAICNAGSDLLGRKDRPVHPILCAVPAKACQRMRKETGRDARTVASILYRTDVRDLENKIVIIDEASMLSLSDAYHLIRKIPDTSRIVFIGDPGQIPSIGAGRFLYDIIKSKAIPCVELTINQRQDEKTDKQLEVILNGKFPEFELFRPGIQSGLYRVVVKNVFAAEEEARKLYALFDGNVQIISPLKKHTGGSDSINHLIHAKHHGRSGFCKGTPIISTKKVAIKAGDRTVYLTNGSIGVITDVLTKSPASAESYLMVNFEFEGEVTLSASEASDFLAMAYCLTCHKAQGSEWETVIIVMPKSDRLLDRNLIYTALSRCRIRSILIYYDHEYIVNRIKSPAAHERHMSGLFGGGNV
jgi:exodeoxyribonuclease V alpha subunit